MNISHISVSRKSTWDQCHQLYKFKYHLQVPSPMEEPFYFVYGKIVHKIAEEYCKNSGERPLGEVAGDVLNGKISVDRNTDGDVFAPKLPDEYRKRLPEHLRSMKKLFDQVGTGGLLEYPFKFDLDPPNGRHVVGFIDRLIQKGDNFFIVDYKTTKRGMFRKNARTVVHDLQLRTYARVVQREFKVPAENIRCALYYLEGGDLIGAKFNDASLLAAEKDLLDVYKQIETANPDTARGTVADHCYRCDYRKVCPFYRLT